MRRCVAASAVHIVLYAVWAVQERINALNNVVNRELLNMAGDFNGRLEDQGEQILHLLHRDQVHAADARGQADMMSNLALVLFTVGAFSGFVLGGNGPVRSELAALFIAVSFALYLKSEKIRARHTPA